MALGGPNERNDYHINETEVRRSVVILLRDRGPGVTSSDAGMVLPTQGRHGSARGGRGCVPGYKNRRGRDVFDSG